MNPDVALTSRSPGEVDVIRLRLDHPSAVLRGLAARLCSDERTRAAAFRRPIHRDRFVSCRGQVRMVLGLVLDRPAHAVPLAQDTHGKPYVDGAHGLFFNVSHDGGAGLLALASAPVGVDLQSESTADEDFAPSVLSPRELAEYAALQSEAQQACLHAVFARKEALLKASGHGLAHPLTTVEVPVGPLTQPAKVETGLPAAAGPYWLYEIPVARPFHAALAATTAVVLRTWDLHLHANGGEVGVNFLERPDAASGNWL